jgi:hypothetical protein
MTTKRGGRKTKGSSISDAFNQLKVGDVLTKRDKAAIKRAEQMERYKQDEEKRKMLEKFNSLKEKVEKAAEKVSDVPEEKPEEDSQENVPEDPQEDEKSAHKMLLDLRYAYRNSKGSDGKKGRQRLVSLMESDPEFKFAVKELLKIESALLAARIRNKENEDGTKIGQQNFFVVLKGLDDERKYLADDKTVDLKQIKHVMNPTAESKYEPEEVVDKRAAPEQLRKT